MIQFARIAVLALSVVATPALAGHHGDKPGNIVETAQRAGQFGTLLAAAKAAGLGEALAGPGPLTVFAPTDEAFARLPEGTVESLLEPRNRDQLVAILKYHVVADELRAKDVLAADAVASLEGGMPAVSTRDGEVFIDQAKILAVDIEASNGVIHVIDQVLMPSTDPTAGAARALIELAIARGAPLYNSGQERACASIYEVAATGLLAMEGLDDRSRRSLERALADVRGSHDWDDRAWTLRRALDRVHDAAGRDHGRMMSLAVD